MNSSFLQSEIWERFQADFGNSVFREHGLLFVEKRTRVGRYAISSRCQIPANFELTKNNYCFWRFEPIDDKSRQNLIEFAHSHKYKLVRQSTVQPRQTMVLDLTLSEADLLKRMKPKTRYNLKIAQKNGLTAEIYSENLEAHFEDFWALHSGTAARQGFRTHAKEYYRGMLREGLTHLLFVKKDGVFLATMLLLTNSDTAVYLHGGSSEHNKNLMAPYLLHWEATKLAKSLGYKIYDFWGTDAVQVDGTWVVKDKAATAGTTRFKLGFGGQIINYPGCYDLVRKPFCYTVYKAIRAITTRKKAFR